MYKINWIIYAFDKIWQRVLLEISWTLCEVMIIYSDFKTETWLKKKINANNFHTYAVEIRLYTHTQSLLGFWTHHGGRDIGRGTKLRTCRKLRVIALAACGLSTGSIIYSWRPQLEVQWTWKCCWCGEACLRMDNFQCLLPFQSWNNPS